MIIGVRKKIFVAGFILISRFFWVKFWRVEAAEDPLFRTVKSEKIHSQL